MRSEEMGKGGSAPILAVSIIVPIYNVEQYLGHCIDSILCQTFTNFELVLVDDGSLDGSGKLSDEYALKDDRIRVIHQANKGVSAARNAGLDIAVGKYICFVDPDDWVAPNYLSTIMRQVQNFDALFWGFSFEYNDGSRMSLSLREQDAMDISSKERILLHLCANDTGYNVLGYVWDKVFRRNIIERYHLRFERNIRFGEDEMFTLAYCLKAESMKVIPNVLYHYLQRAGGLANQKEPVLSCKVKYQTIVRLIPEMKSHELIRMWHKRAYHTLQDVAKLSKKNMWLYILYQLKAFIYKKSH